MVDVVYNLLRHYRVIVRYVLRCLFRKGAFDVDLPVVLFQLIKVACLNRPCVVGKTRCTAFWPVIFDCLDALQKGLACQILFGRAVISPVGAFP